MANKARGEIQVSIAGKDYTLRPSYTAVVEFEDKAGVTVFEAMKALGERQSIPMRSLRQAFHSCIKAAWKPSMGSQPTLDDIGQALHADGLTGFIVPYSQILGNMLAGEKALSKSAADAEAEAKSGDTPGKD